MPWTESRSRDEWLAEVRRRGERIRRRRRLSVSVVAALALLVPAGALVTFLGDGGNRDVRLTASGPPPTAQVAGELPTVVPPPAAAVPIETSTTTTTTAEVSDRLTVAPLHPRTSAPRPDDPVVRPAPTDPSGSTGSPIPAPPQSTTVAPLAGPALAPCPASEVSVKVATERTDYSPGQTVHGSSTLENGSATACLLPTRAFFRILNGTGKDVGAFPYTADLRFPVRAEPGKTFTSSFTWDQKDCTGPACAQVPAGTYTAVADWTESGPYSGRSTFQVSP